MVEGAPHTAKRSRDQLLCLEVPPAPVYKGARGEGAGRQGGRAPWGVLLPPAVGLPPFLVGLGEGGERGGRERKERGGAPSPCPIWTRGRGTRPRPGRLSSSQLRPTMAH